MKIIAAFLVSALLIAFPTWASAESDKVVDATSFIYTDLEGIAGYSYDKFDKEWMYQSTYKLEAGRYSFNFYLLLSSRNPQKMANKNP